ncbi:MAG: lipopolysaccharide heptosyltransferase family protein [Rhodospirillaceae bacterium]|nr:lipopolysaccharide heptosyltransferase family protein [Rhodospirillaceae bacterium]
MAGGRYGELARTLTASGQIPVIVGPDVPAEVVATIMDFCPSAVDLSRRTTVNETVFLAWAATAAVGPDNGAMHLAAAAGCRTVVLYDGASDPALVGHRGGRVAILRRPRLSEISVGEVLVTLETLKK